VIRKRPRVVLELPTSRARSMGVVGLLVCWAPGWGAGVG
jgi:hypothetical protein